MTSQWQAGQAVTLASPSSPALVGGSGGGSAVAIPALSAFSWVNQGTASAVQALSGGPVMLKILDNSSLNWRMLIQTAPAAPYKVSAQIRAARPFSSNTQAAGLYFYDGTKLMGFECLSEGNALGSETSGAVIRKSDTAQGSGAATSAPSGYGQEANFSLNCFAAPIWVQLRNDGTTLYLDWSADGSNFINFYSEPTTAFITPTAFGFGGLSITTISGEFLAVSLLNWLVSANAIL